MLASYNLNMNYVDFLNIEQIYYWIYLIIGNIFYYLNPVRLWGLYYDSWSFFMFYSLVLFAILLAGILYIRYKMKPVAQENSRIFDTVVSSASDFNISKAKNERWEKVIKYVNSDSQAEWRMAILDADVILDEIITKIGYPGESIGEKLKNVEASDFTTINSAWEAHKIRNRVAHEGSDSILSQRLAKKAIGLYKQVFEEFQYI